MKQRYISKEVFHFVGQNKQENEQYEIFKIILSEQKLGTGESIGISTTMRDWDALSSNEVYTGDMVCFCDIPLGDLGIHINHYSPFGISFLKKYLIGKGASPIWYISSNSTAYSKKNSDYHDEMFRIFRYFCDLPKEQFGSNDLLKEAKDLLDYFDKHIFPYMKFFDAEKDDLDKENYYMEREWRLYGVLYFKNLNNINRIILPRSFAKTFRKDFPNYIGQINYVQGKGDNLKFKDVGNYDF